MAVRCSLAILCLTPRNLCQPQVDTLSLGPSDPRSALADWGSFLSEKGLSLTIETIINDDKSYSTN